MEVLSNAIEALLSTSLNIMIDDISAKIVLVPLGRVLMEPAGKRSSREAAIDGLQWFRHVLPVSEVIAHRQVRLQLAPSRRPRSSCAEIPSGPTVSIRRTALMLCDPLQGLARFSSKNRLEYALNEYIICSH